MHIYGRQDNNKICLVLFVHKIIESLISDCLFDNFFKTWTWRAVLCGARNLFVFVFLDLSELKLPVNPVWLDFWFLMIS